MELTATHVDSIDNNLKKIIEWLNKNEIGKTYEKKKDIAWTMMRSVYDNSIHTSEIQELIQYIDDNEFIITEGNIWERLQHYLKNDNNDKYVNLFRDIFNLTPPGLSTSPNAACGKGELFYRLLRPNSRQPSQGDIIDNSIKKELKGCKVRISSLAISGKEYKKITDNVFDGIIDGNSPKTGGLKGKICFEIEKKQYKSHYENEFKRIDFDIKTNLFQTLLTNLNIDGDIKTKVKRITDDENGFNQYEYQLILLEDWFSKYKKIYEFDEFILLGDGSDIKIIKELCNLDKIVICSDYFRINQTSEIGWYIE